MPHVIDFGIAYYVACFITMKVLMSMKKLNKYILLAASILILSGTEARSQESMTTGLSYEYIERLIKAAETNYPDMLVKEQQVIIAKNGIRKTEFSYLDPFTFSYYYRPTQAIDVNNPNLFNGYQIGLNINIGDLIQKPFANKEAKAQYKIAQLQQNSYKLNLAAEVKKRYFKYLEQLSQLKLRSKSYADAESLVKQLRYKFEKSETGFDDLTRALLLSSEQNQFLIAAEGGTFAAKAALEEILGDKLENIK